MSNFKNPVVRDIKWIQTVREMPCVISGVSGPSDPAHIRYGQGGGMGMKPGDNYILPLAHHLHAEQHQHGEVQFWCKHLPENPHLLMECVKAYAEKLYRKKHEISGNC